MLQKVIKMEIFHYVEYVQGIETATEILTNYNEAINNFNQTIIAIQYTINQ